MNNTENKICQNCHSKFTIEPDDFAFYEKIKVPPPTWCPDCRLQRRMSWRNDWHLFKKRDEHNGQMIFSFFPTESEIKIYERNYWNSDAWDPLSCGRDYDWNKPFFVQFQELMRSVPFPAHSIRNMSNCLYCTNAHSLKNCYLVRASTYTEDSAYLIWDTASRRCFDGHMTTNCELCYDALNCERCYKSFFITDCENCQNVFFSKDCVGCNNCLGCIGLRRKSYCIFNQQYSKEEYGKKLKEFNFGSRKSVEQIKNNAKKLWLTFPRKYMHGYQNANVSGEYIYNSKNVFNCYRVHGIEDSKYCQNMLSGPVKNCYDYTNWGENSELIYESLVVGSGGYNVKLSWNAHSGSKDLEYCMFCYTASNSFGCIGLKKKEYCVFNKQYSREEYLDLIPRIKKHMDDMPYVDAKGRVYKYGEFFPIDFSPWGYNISAAQEFFPLDKEAAIEKGFSWSPQETKKYEVTVEADKIPDHISDVTESICDEIIECSHKGACHHECVTAFKIIPEEIAFYKEMNLPLPNLCPNCRHYARLAERNNNKLWRRNCECGGKESRGYLNTIEHFHGNSPCPNEFQTSYAPDRPEIVYCEACYNAEIA